jgi:signal transduction histidine kinase
MGLSNLVTSQGDLGRERMGHLVWSDPLVRILACGLASGALVIAALAARQTHPTTVVIPWFIPTIDSFLVLTGAAVAFLSMGRYRVLNDPASFWTWAGFSSFSIGLLFHFLTFPNLLPPGRAVLNAVDSSPAWAVSVAMESLTLGLFLSALLRWPTGTGARKWHRGWLSGLWLASVALCHLLLVILGPHLPVMVAPDGQATRVLVPVGLSLVVINGLGAALSTRRYLRTRDVLSAYVALCQFTLIYPACATFSVSYVRFGVWWYLQFASWALGFVLLLFALLAEYRKLYHREQERTADLAAANQQLQDRTGDLVRLQAELEHRVQERTAQLVEANANLQAFAYTAAHDLRAPLRSLKGFCSLLAEECAGKLSDEQQALLGRMAASADQMGRLLHDLLEYSKMSQAELKLAPVNLGLAVNEALALLEEDLRHRNAQVTVEEPLPEVVGHLATVVLLINNFVSNALKFMPDGVQPQVRIWAECSSLGPAALNASHLPTHPSIHQLLSPAGVVRLWVEDNGIGIAPENLAKIFGAFERLHAVRDYPGTGLGLAIVRKGAERMGGRVGVESVLGKGSRFWVELRAAVPATESCPLSVPAPAAGQ